MRFDLSGCGAGLDESATSLLELGPLAESLGYDGLWISRAENGAGRPPMREGGDDERGK
jgi:hypothetical protein